MGLNSPDALAPALLETLHCAFPRRSASASARRARSPRSSRHHRGRLAASIARSSRSPAPIAPIDIATIVSELANVDHATTMKAITGQSEEPMVVLFRSLGASWETFEAVLQLRAKRNRRNYVRSPALARAYQEMDRATARRVLRFLQTPPLVRDEGGLNHKVVCLRHAVNVVVGQGARNDRDRDRKGSGSLPTRLETSGLQAPPCLRQQQAPTPRYRDRSRESA